MKESVYIIAEPKDIEYKLECPHCFHEVIFSDYEEAEETKHYTCEECGKECYVEGVEF